MLNKEELLEILADIEHVRWSDWQKYLHSKCIKNDDGSLTIPAGYVVNLERLIKTPYSQLTEKEKESDRTEAKNSLDACLLAHGAEVREKDNEITTLKKDIEILSTRCADIDRQLVKQSPPEARKVYVEELEKIIISKVGLNYESDLIKYQIWVDWVKGVSTAIANHINGDSK